MKEQPQTALLLAKGWPHDHRAPLSLERLHGQVRRQAHICVEMRRHSVPLVERERLSQCELGGLELADALAEKGLAA